MEENVSRNLMQCKTCATDIPEFAKKCIHCGSYQDWRRYIDFGHTTLALLIAFFSVMGILISNLKPAIDNLISDKTVPNYSISILDMDNKKIKLLYTNLGGVRFLPENGLLCRVPVTSEKSQYSELMFNKWGKKLRYPTAGETETLHMLVYYSVNPVNFVEPNSSKVIDYFIHQRRPEKGKPFKSNAKQLPGYCSTGVISIIGKKTGGFTPLSKFHVIELQETLRDTKFYGYPEE